MLSVRYAECHGALLICSRVQGYKPDKVGLQDTRHNDIQHNG
jgi:hypothetical protein